MSRRGCGVGANLAAAIPGRAPRGDGPGSGEVEALGAPRAVVGPVRDPGHPLGNCTADELLGGGAADRGDPGERGGRLQRGHRVVVTKSRNEKSLVGSDDAVRCAIEVDDAGF